MNIGRPRFSAIFLRSLAASAALAAPAIAFAQTAATAPESSEADADTGGAEVIVVTAQKREQSVQDVPASVVAIGGDRLRDALITRASDVSRFVPNFNADTSVGNLTPRWYLRGIGNSVPGAGQTSPVGVYQDEVYVGIPIAQAFPVFDLERVEVLSGPQGTLWGKNTTAGALNFISRKPDFEGSGYARAEYGSYDHMLLEGAWGGALNDKIAVRAAAQFQDNDGYAKNQHDGTAMGKNREAAARFQILFKPTDTFTALLKAQYRDYQNVGDIIYEGYNPKDSGGVAVPQSYKDNASFGASRQSLTQKGVQLNLDLELGDLGLTSISALNDFKQNAVLGSQVDHEGQHTYSDLDARIFSQEFRLASADAGRFKWILGANYYYEKLDSDAVTVTLPNSVGLATAYTDTQFEQTNRSYGLFANGTVDITDRLQLNVGARQTWESKKIDLDTYGSVAGAGALTFADLGSFWLRNAVSGSRLGTRAVQNADENWNAFTYDVSLKYALSKQASLYARYAKGFRSGGFNPGATLQTQVATVDPEYVKSYEAGIKTEWFDGRLTANLAAFYNDYTNIQVTVIQLPLSQLTNAGAGWSKGIEAVLSARPVKSLRLWGTLGLLDTKYTEFPNCKAGVDCSGNQFVRAPHVSASVSGEYTFELGDGSAIVAENNWSYRSHLYFNAGTQAAPLEQDPKWLGNASLSYKLPNNLKFSVFARNLTNSHAASTIIPSANFGFIKYIIEPRVWGGAVSVSF